MENTKAVEILTRWIQFIGYATMEGRRTFPDSLADLSRACTLAIEAIGKQIPKPAVVKRRDGYLLPEYRCPVCNRQIKVGFKNIKEGCFCDRCGQRLSF